MPTIVQRFRAPLTAALCASFLAPSMATLAAPVTVVTHSTGIADINPSALDGLGLPDASGEPQRPYELTLSSTFDWTGPLPARDASASQPDSQVVIDFRLGDLRYHYAGTGSSSAVVFTPPIGGGDGYLHEIWLDPPGDDYGYAFKFTQLLIGPAGSLGAGGALTPGLFDGVTANANFSFTAYRSNDEYTFAFPMGGEAATFSVRVTSLVPEPAAFALLAAGLLTLGLCRHRCVRE